MLTQINILILDIVLDFILIHFLHCKMIRVKMLLFFGVDNSPSFHIDNKKQISLFLVKVQHKDQRMTITTEATYSINFSRSRRKFCLSLYYNRKYNCLFVNAKKIYQLKAKDSEKKCIQSRQEIFQKFFLLII